MDLPTFEDVLNARQTIAPYLHQTPLYQYKAVSDEIGAEVWVKHENHLPVGAFKIRGGVNFMAQLSSEAKSRGVITASTGNHGQSVAYAARLFRVQAVVVMPHGANPGKVESIRNLGAEIRFIGENFDDCRAYAHDAAESEGMYYLSSGDESALVAGVGTYALEIVETLTGVDVIVVPVGGGSGAAGTCLVAKAAKHSIAVIGVQSEAAPSAYLSWKEGERVAAKNETFAEGLATGLPFDMPQAIMRRDLDDFVLVSEDEIRAAMIFAMEKTHNLVEAAGAASFAAALKIRERLTGKRVALVMSGGNISMPGLKALLVEHI